MLSEVYKMRTNIAIDNDLIERAMKISGVKTKKDMVNMALEEYVRRHNQKNLLDIAGKIRLAEGYDYKAMREEK